MMMELRASLDMEKGIKGQIEIKQVLYSMPLKTHNPDRL